MTSPISLPRFPESYWQDSAMALPDYPKLQHDLDAEVTVVGGGISGITTAYLLAKEGYKVVLLEAGKLMNGTTGHTTAKITAQHDLIYDELIKHGGTENARLYYEASIDASRFIESTAEKLKADCAFVRHDAYVYTNSESYLSKLEDEIKAYDKLGIKGSLESRIPLPIPSKAAVKMDNQAQFHPLHYLHALVKAFTDLGGEIYEGTTAVDVEPSPLPRVVTGERYKITCKQVVACTHFPFYDGHGFYFARMHADRSYVLGLKVEDEYPGGMYLSAEDPKRSIRSANTAAGGSMLLLGGQSHKTGQGVCTINHYEELQRFAKEQFDLKEIVYRWSAQDLVTGDKLPFIGRITASSPNIVIATGFRKWGMTNGTAAALLIRDLIMEKANPYEQLYSPSRALSLKTVVNLVAENADVAKHLIAGKLELVHKRPEELANDEGSVVKVNGRRAGAYRDADGQLFLIDTTCTHMGCEVEWNDGERTWDCPCHGSRFSYRGEVVEGPAEQPLKTIQS